MLYLLWHTSKWAKRDEEKKYTKRMLKCFRRAMLRTHGKRWVVGMEKGWKISGNLRNKKPQRMLTMKRIKFDMFAHSFIRSLFRHVFVFVCVSVACASKLSYLLDIRLCALWFASHWMSLSVQHSTFTFCVIFPVLGYFPHPVSCHTLCRSLVSLLSQRHVNLSNVL